MTSPVSSLPSTLEQACRELSGTPMACRSLTEVSGYGLNDITSRDKDITAVAHVTFAVE